MNFRFCVSISCEQSPADAGLLALGEKRRASTVIPFNASDIGSSPAKLSMMSP